MRQTVGAVGVTRDDAPTPAAMDALLAGFRRPAGEIAFLLVAVVAVRQRRRTHWM